MCQNTLILLVLLLLTVSSAWPLNLSRTNLQLLAECKTPGKPLDILLTPYFITVSADVMTCYYCMLSIPTNLGIAMEDQTEILFFLLPSPSYMRHKRCPIAVLEILWHGKGWPEGSRSSQCPLRVGLTALAIPADGISISSSAAWDNLCQASGCPGQKEVS